MHAIGRNRILCGRGEAGKSVLPQVLEQVVEMIMEKIV